MAGGTEEQTARSAKLRIVGPECLPGHAREECLLLLLQRALCAPQLHADVLPAHPEELPKVDVLPPLPPGTNRRVRGGVGQHSVRGAVHHADKSRDCQSAER